ncbi:MAG: glycosyltransferase [Methanobacteriota archaeon]
MKLSIVIPALDEEGRIEKCLSSIVRQDIPRTDYEIIVADGGSRDETVEIAKKYADEVILSDRKGIGYQQNIGAKYATGDILIFIHADTYFIRRNIFRKLLEYFEDKTIVGGAIGHKYYPENKWGIKIFNTFDSFLASFFVYLDMPRTGGPITVVRKDVFNEIDGFIENLYEDVEIGFRLEKIGKIFRDIEIGVYSSNRRLKKEGVTKNVLKYALLNVALKLDKAIEIDYPKIR